MASSGCIYEADLVLVVISVLVCRIELYGHNGIYLLLHREPEWLYKGIGADVVAETVSGSVGLYQEVGSCDCDYVDSLLGCLDVVDSRSGIGYHIAEHDQDLV